MRVKVGYLKLPLLLAGMLVFAGCAQMSTLVSKTPEQRVLERSQARLDALLANDWEKAYGFSSPGYRAQKDVRRFQADFAGARMWVDVNAASAECEEQRCTVLARVSYRPPMGRVGRPSDMANQQQLPVVTRGNQERWVLVDDEWWFFDSR